MTLDEQYQIFKQQSARRQYEQAEQIMQQILQVSGQPWQQYLYLPAAFYEEWGDYVVLSPERAKQCYEQALQYRIRIGNYATGSGEGLEAMEHVNRIERKLERLT